MAYEEKIMSDADGNFISEKLKNSAKVKHRMCCIIIIPTPKQWSGGSMHHTSKT